MKNIILIIITAVITGPIGFYAGTKHQASKQPTFTPGQFRQFRNNQSASITSDRPFPNNGFAGNTVHGEILSIEGDTITVSITGGGSKLVLVSDDTSISKAQEASLNDLQPNDPIMVVGQSNDDGSLSAESINVGGMFRLQPPSIDENNPSL